MSIFDRDGINSWDADVEFTHIGSLSGEIYMKRLALSLLALATVAGIAAPAQAQGFNWRNLPVFSHWNIDSLVSSEQARINAGRANGSLTAQEANRLQNRLNDINTMKARLSRGGINQNEANYISRQMDDLSQDIFRESNDRQMLGSNPWGWSRNYTPNNRDWRYGHWDNGRWVSKNNWNQYNNWRNRNWHNDWNNRDGRPGAGMTAQERARNSRDRAALEQKKAELSADGHLSRSDRREINREERRLDERQRRDRRD